MRRIAPCLLALFVLVVLPMQVQALTSACCYGGSGSDSSAAHDCCPPGSMEDHAMSGDGRDGCHCQMCHISASMPLTLPGVINIAAYSYASRVPVSLDVFISAPLLRPPRVL